MNRRNSAVIFLAVMSLLCFAGLALAQGINTPDPSLPPFTGKYVSPMDVHAMYSGTGLLVVLSQIEHKPIALESRMAMGADEQESFLSNLNGMVSVNLSPPQPMHAQGLVTTKVFNKVGNTTGTFQTEMLSMNLSGSSPFGPFMIRESPTLPTLGQTSIAPIGGGMYHIDSFFDVFTELSLDGGQTWMPSTSSVRVTLLPEPAGMVLIALGWLGVAGLARRHR